MSKRLSQKQKNELTAILIDKKKILHALNTIHLWFFYRAKRREYYIVNCIKDLIEMVKKI